MLLSLQFSHSQGLREVFFLSCFYFVSFLLPSGKKEKWPRGDVLKFFWVVGHYLFDSYENSFITYIYRWLNQMFSYSCKKVSRTVVRKSCCLLNSFKLLLLTLVEFHLCWTGKPHATLFFFFFKKDETEKYCKN